MKLTAIQKADIKAYRLWAVMQQKDQARCDYEYRIMDCLGLHNAHVLLKLQKNYYTCATAREEYEKKLNLYPQ